MLKTGDVVAIEGYAYNAKGRGVEFQYGLGAVIRVALHQNKIPFVEVAPTALKKFAGAKGNAPKADVSKAVEAKWGYWWTSDNITDAYVLAMYAREYFAGEVTSK
jgi:crossover junction endodeoxyribonuclease RuvC